MNDEQKPAPGTKLCKWAVWIAAAGVVVTLIGILGAAALGPFRAMLSLTLGSLLLIIGAVLAVIGPGTQPRYSRQCILPVDRGRFSGRRCCNHQCRHYDWQRRRTTDTRHQYRYGVAAGVCRGG